MIPGVTGTAQFSPCGAWDGNDDTSESWHCCVCHCDYVTGGQA